MALCDALTRYAGHCYGPQFHYMWAAVPVVLFAYGYVSGMAMRYYPDLLFVLLFVSLPFVIVIHWILHGVFHRAGIRSVFASVNRINAMYDGVLLKQGRTVQEYDQLLKDLTKLPILRMATSLLDVFIFLVPSFTYEFTVRGLTNLTAYLQAIAITIPNLMFFSYLTTDLHLFRSRAQVRKKIYHLGASPGHYYAFSLRRKFIIILLLIALSGYLLITLMSSQPKQNGSALSNSVILYAIIAMLNLAFLMGLFIYNIFQAIYTLEKMSHSLRASKEPDIFSGTADKELSRLSDGLFSAAQKLLRHQKELEEKVKERTQELTQTNEILQQQKTIMDLELEMAAEIQQSMFANTARAWNELRFAALSQPMARVSGDYYDIFCQQDFVYIIMADVSGHGVPAALVSIGAKNAFNEALRDSPTPAETCRRVNRRLLEQVKTQEYLTAFVVRIDVSYKAMFCNAGHTKALLFRQATDGALALDSAGIFLGALETEDNVYQDDSINLLPGDRLFLYTDGVTECENHNKEPFGEQRLINFIRANETLSILELNKAILLELKKYNGNSDFRDDITLMFLELPAKVSADYVV